MREKRFIYVILFLIIVIFDVLLADQIKKTAEYIVPFDESAFQKVLRNQQIPADVRKSLHAYCTNDDSENLSDYMFAYLYTGLTAKNDLQRSIQYLEKRYPDAYKRYRGYEQSIWSDVQYFPVAESKSNAQATVTFEDSWMQSRTFGGNRGHEGCDIMATIHQRGYYPIVSVSDGKIEKIGWLSQGGYRIGIRSRHGAYFYYAHLYDYARDFKEGDSVFAGELIGFIMLFSIIASMINLIPISSTLLRSTLIGIVEITNGIQTVSQTTINLDIKYLLCVAFTAFGGLSGLAQTSSMVSESHLPMKHYLIAKLLLCLCSGLLAGLFFRAFV